MFRPSPHDTSRSGPREEIDLFGARTAARREPEIWSVSAITHRIRDVLEGTFGEVWISGEGSNFRTSLSPLLTDISAAPGRILYMPSRGCAAGKWSGRGSAAGCRETRSSERPPAPS